MPSLYLEVSYTTTTYHHINQRVLIITLRQPPYAIGAGLSKSI